MRGCIGIVTPADPPDPPPGELAGVAPRLTVCPPVPSCCWVWIWLPPADEPGGAVLGTMATEAAMAAATPNKVFFMLAEG